ncbi:Uma2 family endonuclease [Gracilibacillus sp. YIM 98692]|uniref:Uma2 family endonuclease n=1 Tax=Gracilibacillus sp. YIM 98692 TaxID=2663532 RepID=UPI001F090CA3|nr:Uma2 family endonuclease [Gracilibacillus sp. YIM 98692]
MSPAPSRKYQQILREITTSFSVFLRNKECELYFAPFDVRLLVDNKQDNQIDNVVQPDLTIVYDQNKLDDKGCNGTPDMIIEILSPSFAYFFERTTSKSHRLFKFVMGLIL